MCAHPSSAPQGSRPSSQRGPGSFCELCVPGGEACGRTELAAGAVGSRLLLHPMPGLWQLPECVCDLRGTRFWSGNTGSRGRILGPPGPGVPEAGGGGQTGCSCPGTGSLSRSLACKRIPTPAFAFITRRTSSPPPGPLGLPSLPLARHSSPFFRVCPPYNFLFIPFVLSDFFFYMKRVLFLQ